MFMTTKASKVERFVVNQDVSVPPFTVLFFDVPILWSPSTPPFRFKIDGTFGRGGHSRLILSQLGEVPTSNSSRQSISS
ncbi:hypothetical protein O5833_29370, partial [Escherichia coli]|nr:hypothetical protein [Escherichia coli]